MNRIVLWAMAINQYCLQYLLLVLILCILYVIFASGGFYVISRVEPELPSNATFIATTRTIRIETSYPVALKQPYQINNQHLCREVEKITCIVIVYSSPDNYVRRNNLRQTFLNVSAYTPEVVRVVYLLGRVQNSSLQDQIEQENLIYRDIVQGSFLDSYKNLTNKGVMGLKWISEFCLNSEFALKMDDDVFVNFFRVFQRLSFLRDRTQRYLVCDRVEPGIYPIQRLDTDKWYIHKDQLKRMSHYPYTSCLGPSVFMSINLVPLLYTATYMSPFFWVDDVYLFGMVASKIPGVIHFDIRANVSFNFNAAEECFIKYGLNCSLIVGMPNPRKGGIFEKMWTSITAFTKGNETIENT